MLLTNAAILSEMRRDPRIVAFATQHRPNWVAEFGAERVKTFPISEHAMTGMAIGAAIAGLVPLVELHRSAFMFVAMDQIVNQAAKLKYATGGQVSLAVTIRSATLWHDNLGAQHEQIPYGMFLDTPGLKVVVPGSLEDAAGLMRSALRDPDPVLLFESPAFWDDPADERFVDDIAPVPIGQARTYGSGQDATLVAIGGMLAVALEAARRLRQEGILCEVIDPRTLVPLDGDAIRTSVRKTGRLVVVDEAPSPAATAALIAATAVEGEQGSHVLKSPVVRLCGAPAPTPFSPLLQRREPSVDSICAAVRDAITPASGIVIS